MALFVLGWARDSGAQDRNTEKTPQPFVNKIIFEGNHFFSAKKLRALMRTKESTFFSIFRKPRLNPDVLQRDIATLEATYHSNGFLEAKVGLKELVKLEGGTFVNIVIQVTENEPTRVESVIFHHTGIISDKDLRKNLLLEKGDPYNPSLVGSDVSTIKLKYFDKGYLAVVVRDSVDVQGRSVWIHYSIDPGPLITIRSINIVGNRLTKRSIVEKEITVRVGQVFSLKDAVETQRNLFETGLFN